MDLDAPVFSLNQVGNLAGITDLKLLSNWTDRGLVDPHMSPEMRRRGRGRQRLYSGRDVLRFAVMKDLADRYAVPVPLGTRICESVLGNLNPKKPGIFVIEKAKAGQITSHWCADAGDLGRRLQRIRAYSVLLVNTFPLIAVLSEAVSAFRALPEEGDRR